MDTNDSKAKSFNPMRLTWSQGQLISENAEQLACHVLSSQENRTEVNKVIVENDENVFVGERDESPLTNNYIVIRNRKTDTVRWYKTINFFMQPHRSEPESKEVAVKAVSERNESKRDAILKLDKIMGSKKNKRKVMEAEKMNVSADNVEKKLKIAIKKRELVVEKTNDVSPTSEEFPYLPPRDKNVNSVEQVYKVYDLISPDIMNSLNEITEEILRSDVFKLTTDDRLTSFFMACYVRVTKPDPTKIKLLLFADSLMKFLKEQARNIKMKKFVLCTYSSALNTKILEEFCAVGLDNVRTRPPSMRDKAYCYILVCLFLISNFTVDIGIFSGIAVTDYHRLPILMRAVGATKERDSNTSFRLKLPLAELPAVKAGRKSGAFGKKR